MLNDDEDAVPSSVTSNKRPKISYDLSGPSLPIIKQPSSIISLIDAAIAISESNTEAARLILDQLGEVSDKCGSPEQRLSAYMIYALRSRMNPIEFPPPISQLSSRDHIDAIHFLYVFSPCFRLGFLASNLTIVESLSPQSHTLHVLDFDREKGSQYINLIFALSKRQTTCLLKITTVDLELDPSTRSEQFEDRWSSIEHSMKIAAASFDVRLEYQALKLKMSDLTRDALSCSEDEELAVSFGFRLHKLADESMSTENSRDELLRIVKEMRPRVVTIAEQEMNCNMNTLVDRVEEASEYYLTLFHSLNSTFTSNQQGFAYRLRIEESLGRKAANSVACEGKDRVDRCEPFEKWRARMGMAGFELKPLSSYVAQNVWAMLKGMRTNSKFGGFNMEEENGRISFTWNFRTLTVMSSWH